MPTYLRWIAAISTGITVQLIFTLATVPFAQTTTAAGETVIEVNNVTGLLLTLANTLLVMVSTLWVNDWIVRRYPREG